MNKLTKVLSVFVIAGAIGTGVAGVAGCTPKKPNDEGGHTHNYTLVNDNNGKHHEHCDADGCDAPDKAAVDHVWGTDDKCECGATKPAEGPVTGEGVTAPAGTDGIIVEYNNGGLENVTLSEDLKSYTLDLSKIKVYYATGSTKGEAIPAANYKATVSFEGEEITTLTGLKQGHYEVYVELQGVKQADGTAATWEKYEEFDILNPVKAGSLVVKEGATLEQVKSVQDKMTSTWTYEVTLANGDKQDVPAAEVKVTGLDTNTVTEEATATLTWGTITGSVKYKITANTNLHVQSYAVNMSALSPTTGDENVTAEKTLLDTKKDGSGTVLSVLPGSKAKFSDGTAETEDKYFNRRLQFGAGSYDSKGAWRTKEGETKYFTLKTESAAKLTIVWNTNGTAGRGIKVYSKAALGEGGLGATTSSSEALYSKTVADKEIYTSEIALATAGEYYITTANDGDVYFFYFQIDTEFDGDDVADVALEDGDAKLTKLSVKTTTEGYKQEFTLGATFSVSDEYSYEGTFATTNTGKKSKQTLTEVTYWLGDTQLVPNTTVLSADLFEKLGENTVTVKYGEEAVTGSYKINVVNALGVNSVNATLKSDVTTEVAQADSTISISWANFNLTTTGENENVDVVITAVSYVAKDAAAGTEGTAIEENGTAIGVGTYVVTFTVTVTDKDNSTLTETFTATCDLRITLAGSLASWLYQTANATVGESNPGIAKDAVIIENGSFKAEALDAAKSGYARNNSFDDNIKDSANADNPGANKPVAAASATASGEEIVFTNAVSFDSKAGTGKDYIKVTAKKATTVYIYLNASDDGHKSNRSGAQVYYSLNSTACAEDKVITVGNRKTVTVLTVTLAENDVLVVSAKQGTSSNDPRIWFYGIEAVDVA